MAGANGVREQKADASHKISHHFHTLDWKARVASEALAGVATPCIRCGSRRAHAASAGCRSSIRTSSRMHSIRRPIGRWWPNLCVGYPEEEHRRPRTATTWLAGARSAARDVLKPLTCTGATFTASCRRAMKSCRTRSEDNLASRGILRK